MDIGELLLLGYLGEYDYDMSSDGSSDTETSSDDDDVFSYPLAGDMLLVYYEDEKKFNENITAPSRDEYLKHLEDIIEVWDEFDDDLYHQIFSYKEDY